jgi:hypothetical protein
MIEAVAARHAGRVALETFDYEGIHDSCIGPST